MKSTILLFLLLSCAKPEAPVVVLSAEERAEAQLVALVKSEGFEQVAVQNKPAGLGLTVIRAVAAGPDGTTVARTVLADESWRTYGKNAAADLSELPAARTWYRAPPPAADLLPLIDAAYYDGALGALSEGATLRVEAADLELRFFRRAELSRPRTEVRVAFPASGLVTVREQVR